MLILELHGIEWDHSVMRLSYKLTKIATKTEKFENVFEKD